MDMEVAGRAVVTLPKILYLKIRYGSRLRLAAVQSLGPHSLLRIGREGRASVGKETVSRGNLSLRVEKGTLSIGDKCFFNSNCSITCLEKVTIGDRCQFANNLVIVDHDHDYRAGWGHYRTKAVRIGNDVWVGANCVILKGADIGDRCVIAAGSVVSGKVEPGTVFYQRREAVRREAVSAFSAAEENKER